MASQEFLASFAVDIDESGVARLQQVLEENRDLAGEVAAAFEAATAAIKEYEAAASGNQISGDRVCGKIQRGQIFPDQRTDQPEEPGADIFTAWKDPDDQFL